MISTKEAIFYHQILIRNFGGINGLRDLSLLEAALERPFMTFGGQELYPSTIEKAAALLESIVLNHPFLDGNKRLGYLLMRLILENEQYKINATDEEKYKLVISTAEGKMKFKEIVEWLNEHCTS